MALHYILDGYNIINGVHSLANLSLQDGRDALLKLLVSQRPQGSLRNDVTVVFDGKEDVWGQPPSGEVKVIFTSGETADEYIKRLVEQDRDIKNIVVVTNDREICYYIRQLGATDFSVQQFLELRSGYKQRQQQSRQGDKLGQQKQITRVMQNQINKELEDLWINRKKKP